MNAHADDLELLDSPLREAVAEIAAEPIPAQEMLRALDRAVRVSTRSAGAWKRLTKLQHLAAASIAVSAILGLVLVLSVWSVPTPLSAMERMAKELQQINSYACRSTGRNSGINDGKRLTIKDEATSSWLAPGAYHQRTRIVKAVENASGGEHTEELVEDLEETYPDGKPGVLVDHKHKTFTRIVFDHTDEPHGAKTYPWQFLRLIRQGSYQVERDLGTKQIGEIKAHGYRLMLKGKNGEGLIVKDPIELWVDPKTNLPLDISWSGGGDGWKHEVHATDFRWNLPVDASRFEPIVPAGYADITPPSDPKDLVQIASVLRLYATLNGGHYPQSKSINPTAIHDEMLNMPNITPQQRKQIADAMPGLDWIARILRNRYVAGYRGLQVGPTDRDDVLLWWVTDNRYRVFFGDLRTEIISESAASKLGLTNSDKDDSAGN